MNKSERSLEPLLKSHTVLEHLQAFNRFSPSVSNQLGISGGLGNGTCKSTVRDSSPTDCSRTCYSCDLVTRLENSSP